MIFTIGLPVASVDDVRYRWLAGGILGAAESSNISQCGTFLLFRIDTTPPVDAEELIVYDVNDLTNYAIARYGGKLSLLDVAVSTRAESSGESGGAFAITITVTDEDSVPLENARVRITEGVNTFVNTTGVDGIANFNLDAATYVLGVTKSGYSFAGSTIDVTGDANFNAEMEQIVIPAPTNPALSAGHLTTRDGHGNAEGNVSISFQLISAPGLDSYPVKPFLVVSDDNGSLISAFRRQATYRGKRTLLGSIPNSKVARTWVPFTVPDADTFPLPQILGEP